MLMGLVNVEQKDGVATLTLNNPAERNTMTAEMVADISAAMDEIEGDPKVGALIVTGAAPAFCAGANLGNLAEADGASLTKIYEGFLRIAAARAKFDTRFLQIGLHPGGGHTWMFRNIAGPQATMAAVVFGEILDGVEAERVGLAYKCVPDDELMTVAHTMATRAASVPRELTTLTKRTIQEMANVATHEQAVAKELEPQVWTTRQPWFAERLAALQSRLKK